MSDENSVKTYVVDAETFTRLETLAKMADRSNSWMIRNLINQAYELMYSQPNPTITVSEAVKASE